MSRGFEISLKTLMLADEIHLVITIRAPSILVHQPSAFLLNPARDR
jgi:hypothetical protein